jgi:hypothetical protein
MQVPNQQYHIFKTSLTNNIHTSHVFPESVETDRVYQFEDYFAGSRGYEGLWFFVKEDEQGNFYMDYYFCDDDTECHYRIDHNGEHIRLENMITQWSGRIRTGDPVEDEKQRQREIIHNKEVHAILKAKGFRTDVWT